LHSKRQATALRFACNDSCVRFLYPMVQSQADSIRTASWGSRGVYSGGSLPGNPQLASGITWQAATSPPLWGRVPGQGKYVDEIGSGSIWRPEATRRSAENWRPRTCFRKKPWDGSTI